MVSVFMRHNIVIVERGFESALEEGGTFPECI
jgi:hypothetical protein